MLTLLLALGVVIGATGCKPGADDLAYVKERGKIIIGITDYQPMDYKEAGSDEWIGFDADLARMFAEELGVTCEFVELVDWDAKGVELKVKNIDLVWNGMTAKEELLKQMDFSVSYAKNAQVAVVKENSTIATKDQIKTAKVAVEKGSAGADVAEAEGITNLAAPGNQKVALMEVLSGESEVAIVDITMAQSLVGKGDFAGLKMVEGVSYGDEIFAVGLRRGSDLAPVLDAFLKAKYADGTMAQLAEKYVVGLNTDALSK